ncbi:MAG: ABC transporter permease [Burkholderiales bacterium]|nr:ABC transporter permease [Burkholderiales bacterium]
MKTPIQLQQNDIEYIVSMNRITCKINTNALSYNILIKEYCIVIHKKNIILDRFKISDVTANLYVHKNDQYVIRVIYENESGHEQSVDSTSFLIDLALPSKEDILSKISISCERNRISCDTSKCKELIYRIASYIIKFEDDILYKESTEETFFTYKYNKSGCYKLLIYYSDYNSKIQLIEVDINAITTKLSSDLITINKKRGNRDFKLMLSIIFAFVIREFQRKYDKGYFRYFSIILGPSVQLGIMVFIFTLMGKKSVLGLGIPLFVLTGILPYGFFTSAGNCLTIISANRALLSYKQVKIIDTLLASVLMELVVTISIFLGGLVVCYYLGVRINIYNPLSLICSFLLLFLFTFGIAMVLSVVGFYFAEFNYAIQVIFRALFYVSGVFFSIDSIPVQYQKFFLWNPLLQLIEFIRFSFVGFQIPHQLSYLYVIKCTVFCVIFGLSLYFINRNKFLINDRAR